MRKLKTLKRRLEKLTPSWLRPLPNFNEMSKAEHEEWCRCATERELHAAILGCQPWEVQRELTDEELQAIIEAYHKVLGGQGECADLPDDMDYHRPWRLGG